MAPENDRAGMGERPEADEVQRLRSVWEVEVRRVRRLYAELERAIRDADSAERAYNLALRAAKIQRTDMGGLLLALVGVTFGDPPA
jgi:hypothetical protein